MEDHKVRLIDAEAFKRYVDCGHLRPPTEICFSEIDVVSMIDRQPAVDAVPVVRCKDCRHARHVLGYEGLKCVWCNRRQTVENEYGFCYNGEKMDGDEK